MTGGRTSLPRRRRLVANALAAVLAVLGLLLLLWPLSPSLQSRPRPAPAERDLRIVTEVAVLGRENRRLRAELDGLTLPAQPGQPPIVAPEMEVEEGAALPGTGNLLLRVVRPDRSPVVSVAVAFSRRSVEAPFAETEHREAVTGEDGTAEFADLAPGPALVSVRRPDRDRQIPVSLEPGRTLLVTIPLPSGVILEGRVLRPGAGGVPDLRVRLSRRGGGLESFFTRTDPHGAYRIEGVPPGRYAVSISGPGYVRPIHISGEERTVTVPEEPRVVRDLYIGVPSIHGRVTDAASGLPVADVEVLIGELQMVRAKTDGEGSFVVADLGPGETTIRLRRPGYAYAAARVQVGEADTGTAVDVALRPEVGVVLLVTDGAGAPYTGRLTVYWGLPLSPSSSVAVGQTVATDKTGQTRLGHLAEGKWRLFFKTESQGQAEVTVELHRGENRIPVRLE